MRNKYILVFLFAILSVFLITGVLHGEEVQESAFLFKPKNKEAEERIKKKFEESHLKVKKISSEPIIYKISINKKERFFLFSHLTSSDVEYIEEEKRYKILSVPNDTYYPSQWGLAKISAPSAWEITRGSNSVVVAVIDTGVEWSHSDLSGKIWENSDEVSGNATDDDANGYIDDVRGWDFIDNDNDPQDLNGHGTAVAGVIGAMTNNNLGIAGVDWQAKIMPIRAFNNAGESTTSLVIEAIEYAKNNGAKIINMSWGGYEFSQALLDVINTTYNAGVVLVGSAGNDGLPYLVYPARYPNVIAVGAVNSFDQRSSFSNYGPELDVVAPGESIYTLFKNNGYIITAGTSFSAPFVSGGAALILGKYPTFSNDQIVNRITSSADKILAMGLYNFTNEYGYGRINLFRSLLKLVKGSGPAVYLISLDGNTKHLIESPEVLVGWGFDWRNIEIISDSEINSFATGSPISFTLKGSNPAVYLIDQGKRKLIINPDIFVNWGFDWGKIAVFPDVFVNGFIYEGQDLKRLARGSGPTVYLMDRGFKNPIPNPDIFLNWGFRWEDIVVLSDAFINSKPTGKTLKRIAKSVSSPTVYLMDQNLKKPIPDIATFYRWNFYWEDLVIVSDEFLYYYQVGGTLKNLAKASSPAVYFIENGTKRLIPDPGTFNRLGFRWPDVLITSGEFLYFYPEGPPKIR